MKIAHFPFGFLPTMGGAEFATHNIAKELTLAGNDVTVITWMKGAAEVKEKYPEDLPYKIETLPSKVYGLAQKSFFKLSILSKPLLHSIKKLQKKYNFDVWHFNMASYQAMILIPWLNENGIPSVVTCQGQDIQTSKEINYGMRLNSEYDSAFKRLIPQGTFFTAISESVKDEYLQVGIPEEKISIIPNGVEWEKIRNFESDEEEVRKTMDWPDDKKILLTVGRNHPKKGYSIIPDVVDRLLKLREDFIWIVIGRNNDKLKESSSKNLRVLDEIGIKSNEVKTLSLPTDNLISVYKSADYFVFPTLMETFGTVQVEAMAAGLPVITTDAAGARDVVKDGFNGINCPQGNAQAMADGIHELIDNKEMSEKFIKNGYDSCPQYSWSVIAEKYSTVYEDSLNKFDK